jgi:hypothetical protein
MTIRRGLPQAGDAPARTAAATAEVLTFRPRSTGLPAGFLDQVDAGYRGAAAAETEAAKDRRLDELERECADLRAEVRGLREELREAGAATAAAVADAERRARHELLGEARHTVAGHRMPSIRPGGSA